MYKNIYRLVRISKEIQKEVSYILQKSIHNPNFNKFSTVLDVKVSPDYSFAKIYIYFNKKTSFNNVLSLNILNKSSSYIRFLLSKKLTLRTVPKLIFVHDFSLTEGEKISNLLKNL
ncbi:MAG: 30S ribosome-binding factor RbfA [Buchnera aphidicola (Periphyllus acericola)]|uniref:30S ribosome-binding factor RbfA n=1 Tax=Buchnera aphidicola TaxID=9 RepID=UPI0030D0CA6C|nr:30S ribosome-binding factor RbfA [Buchnera aphidicola (Periphyllus acericola)]